MCFYPLRFYKIGNSQTDCRSKSDVNLKSLTKSGINWPLITTIKIGTVYKCSTTRIAAANKKGNPDSLRIFSLLFFSYYSRQQNCNGQWSVQGRQAFQVDRKSEVSPDSLYLIMMIIMMILMEQLHLYSTCTVYGVLRNQKVKAGWLLYPIGIYSDKRQKGTPHMYVPNTV